VTKYIDGVQLGKQLCEEQSMQSTPIPTQEQLRRYGSHESIDKLSRYADQDRIRGPKVLGEERALKYMY
jgi:hypothetical protein